MTEKKTKTIVCEFESVTFEINHDNDSHKHIIKKIKNTLAHKLSIDVEVFCVCIFHFKRKKNLFYVQMISAVCDEHGQWHASVSREFLVNSARKKDSLEKKMDKMLSKITIMESEMQELTREKKLRYARTLVAELIKCSNKYLFENTKYQDLVLLYPTFEDGKRCVCVKNANVVSKIPEQDIIFSGESNQALDLMQNGLGYNYDTYVKLSKQYSTDRNKVAHQVPKEYAEKGNYYALIDGVFTRTRFGKMLFDFVTQRKNQPNLLFLDDNKKEDEKIFY